MEYVNPFRLEGQWFKANLHTHTNTSDGELSPAEQIERYVTAGYDILALTDHHGTNNIAPLVRNDIMVVSGMEYHPLCPGNPIEYHLVALNVPHGFTLTDKTDAAACVREVRAAGGESILAHPFWNGLTLEQMLRVRDVVAVEVYNSSCDYTGRAVAENEWSQCLAQKWHLPCVASDDSHWRTLPDFFMGWTWLKMPELTVPALLNALRSGACYASTGPEIRDFRIENGMVRLQTSPAAAVHFMCGPGGGQGCRILPADGESITSAEIPVPKWPFVRAVVTDARGKRAWSNPIFPENEARA